MPTNPPTCPYCDQTEDWVLTVVYSRRMSIANRKPGPRLQTKEEVRCGKCGRKMPMKVSKAVKQTPQMTLIRREEEELCRAA